MQFPLPETEVAIQGSMLEFGGLVDSVNVIMSRCGQFIDTELKHGFLETETEEEEMLSKKQSSSGGWGGGKKQLNFLAALQRRQQQSERTTQHSGLIKELSQLQSRWEVFLTAKTPNEQSGQEKVDPVRFAAGSLRMVLKGLRTSHDAFQTSFLSTTDISLHAARVSQESTSVLAHVHRHIFVLSQIALIFDLCKALFQACGYSVPSLPESVCNGRPAVEASHISVHSPRASAHGGNNTVLTNNKLARQEVTRLVEVYTHKYCSTLLLPMLSQLTQGILDAFIRSHPVSSASVWSSPDANETPSASSAALRIQKSSDHEGLFYLSFFCVLVLEQHD